MNDPLEYIAAVEAAYALPAPEGLTVLDVIVGGAIDSPVPHGLIAQKADGYLTAFRGTKTWEDILADIDDIPAETPDGPMSDGMAETWDSFRLLSGDPMAKYSGSRVTGHSSGACMAAAWARRYASPEYCLFAYPRLCGRAITAALATLAGVVCQVRGDPIAGLLTGWPSAPASKTTVLAAPGTSINPIYYHELATYRAALTASKGVVPTLPMGSSAV